MVQVSTVLAQTESKFNSHMVDVGTVIGANDPRDPLLFKRVFLTPMRGWEKNPDGPESE